MNRKKLSLSYMVTVLLRSKVIPQSRICQIPYCHTPTISSKQSPNRQEPNLKATESVGEYHNVNPYRPDGWE